MFQVKGEGNPIWLRENLDRGSFSYIDTCSDPSGHIPEGQQWLLETAIPGKGTVGTFPPRQPVTLLVLEIT